MSCSSRPGASPRRSGSVTPTGPRGTHRLTVPADRAGERLDRYLPEAIPGISRARGQRLIEEGNVRLAGEIVRPLDRDTSGILVVARTDAAHGTLSARFAAHAMDRKYRGIVFGGPPADR